MRSVTLGDGGNVQSFLIALFLFIASASIACAGDAPSPTGFYRGINLNGPALAVDGRDWEGNDAKDFRCNGKSFENQNVALIPPTDANRARMIRSSRWGGDINVELLNVPAGYYQVFLYVWEDNDSTTFSISVNDRKVLERFASGVAGAWKKLGPWRTRVTDGILRVSARGGDANLSGIEVWSGIGETPDSLALQFNTQPRSDELAFFESKIRPILIERCYECHSQESKELGGNLLLDSQAGVMRGGDGGPVVVPRDPKTSSLIRAVTRKDPDLTMPPEDELSAMEIADLTRWVELGAPDPRSEDTVAAVKAKSAIDWDKARDFWSLRPLVAPPVPAVEHKEWPVGPLDRFVLAKQEAAGLQPTGDPDKPALLRRVTFDLIGLPPTPNEIAAFVQDDSPDAFAKVVDRLLASPHYGERWGRHWLDVVRYSDTAGDNSDFPVPQLYLYRNWVIDAFNRDLPYNQFVKEQLAGDLMGGDSEKQQHDRLIATGYIANARRFGSRVDDYPWHLTIEDTIDNVGRTFLATTINCARCHNHKFDPVTHEDYYALYGIFHSTRYPWPGIELEQKQRDLVPLVSREEVKQLEAERREKQNLLDAEVKRLERLRDAAEGDARKSLDKELDEAKQRAKKHSQTPLPFEQAYAVAEAKTIEDVCVQLKGDPTKSGPLVPRRFLSVLGGQTLSESDKTSGRLRLANWIVDEKNPLTARVMVNRIWLHHFGKGLAPTPNDFGRQGKAPTHPELLDYLAFRFIQLGWSMKALHREILLSHTYRQSSRRDEKSLEVDPSNELLAGYPRRRLDAEAIRDALLYVSGRLDETPGKGHPFPPQTEWKFTQHNPFKAIYDTNRRSVYLMTQRIQRHPYLAIFDGADPSISVGQRQTSTTPLQALYLLNDAFVHEQAAALATRLLNESSQDAERLTLAYLRLFGRTPTSHEAQSALEFLAKVKENLQLSDGSSDQLELQSWQALARVLFRLNEFAYLD